MATKEQYDFFKEKFKAEFDANVTLTKRGEIYLSVISLFLTGLIFKINDIIELIKKNYLIKYTFLLCLGLIMASAIMVMLSFTIRKYEDSLDVQKWFDELSDDEQPNNDFFDHRINDFLVSITRNGLVNNKKGAQLKIASYLILATILSIGIFIGFIVLL